MYHFSELVLRFLTLPQYSSKFFGCDDFSVKINALTAPLLGTHACLTSKRCADSSSVKYTLQTLYPPRVTDSSSC